MSNITSKTPCLAMNGMEGRGGDISTFSVTSGIGLGGFREKKWDAKAYKPRLAWKARSSLPRLMSF